MKYRQDNDAMFLRAKINAIWETIGDDMPNILANNGKLERVFRCQLSLFGIKAPLIFAVMAPL